MRCQSLCSSLRTLSLACGSLLALSAAAGPGTLDPTFAPAVNGGAVYATAVQPDGRILLGGAFTSVNNSSSRNHLARLFADGSLDTSFFNTGNGVSSTVWCLAVQTDGRIVIGGDFTSVLGTTRTRVARLNVNGTLDASFVPTNAITGSVLALAAQSDNKVIIGGSFSSTYFPAYNARLNADGTTDTAFSSYPNGPVNAVGIQSDGKIVIGGAFTTVNGAPRNRIARLNADGSLDNTFQNGLSGASSIVRCLQIQTDGKILIGGDFTGVNSTSRSYVARLNSNGSLDTGFVSYPGASSAVYALAVRPDSGVVIGGNFTSYASSPLTRVARLYADGTRDTAFTSSGINNIVQALAVQSDGALLIGGTFTTVNTSNRLYFARLYGNLYPPEFVTQPVSRNTNVGAAVTFSALVSNPTPSYYQWRKDGVNIPGATGLSYYLGNVQFADAGSYSVFVNNAFGGITSSNAVLNVGIAPAITEQPVSLAVTQGQSATFSVTATGTPLNYFWRKNGAFITEATSSAYTIASVVASNAATYTCQVSNFLGSVTSAGATLTVYSPPVITVQPISQTVGVGSNFTVSVTATGNPAPGYQWNKDGVDIPGATDTSFTVTGAQANDAGGYAVVLTNMYGAATSAVANISVLYYAPTITSQPVGQTLLVGSNFTLMVSATGTDPLAYQWRKNGEELAGANGTSYSVTGAQTNDSGAYTVVVTNVAGSETSAVAVVNVGYAPAIVQQPEPFTNNLGTSNAFSVVVFGSEPLLYQWFKDGIPISDATNSLLPLSNLQSNQVGYYSVTVTNLHGWTASSNALLSIPGVPLPFLWQGLVAYYPFNGNADDASGNKHNGTNNGAALVSDRFKTPNQAMSFDGLTNHVSADVRTLSDYPLTLSVWFVTTNVTSITRGMVSIPRSLAGSGARLGCENGKVEGGSMGGGGPQGLFSPFAADGKWHHALVSCTPSGNNLLFLDGLLVAEDQRTPTLVLSLPLQIGRELISPTGDGSGTRNICALLDDVRVYNRALSSNEVVQLYAYEADLPVITGQPQAQTVAQGGTATFGVTATAAHPLIYQWFKDGLALARATNATLTLTNVQLNQIGYYSVGVSNAVAGVLSANAALNVSGYDFSQWQGLVAYYAFNGNANDESGYAHHGTIYGAVASTNRFGETAASYSFNGIDNYIQTPVDSNLQDLSLAAWFRTDSRSGSRSIVDSDVANNFGHSLILAYSQANNSLDVEYHNGIFSSSWVLNDSLWHHAVAAISPGLVRLYVDGVAVGSKTFTQGSLDGSPFRIGRHNAGTPKWFAGDIDDVRIYNRVLLSNEVAQLYAFEADLPVITGPPQAQTVTQGGAATFNVTATAAYPLTYQWFKDGQALTGATNATLTLTNVQPNQIGYYSVGVSNAVAGVLSANAALSVSGYDFSQWWGLVAYYPFSGNADDASGNGIQLANHGADLATDRFGIGSGSYWFDGMGYMVSSNAFPIVGNTPRTVSLWCYRTNIQFGAMVLWGDFNAGYGKASALYLESQGQFFVNGFYSDAMSVATNMLVGTGTWLHLVYTYSNSLSDVSIYANGVVIPSFMLNVRASYWDTAPNTPLRIGSDSISGPNNAWQGALDDIRIYNRALSADEVQQLYASELQAGMWLSAQVTTNGVDLSFPATANLAYSVLFRTNLAAGLWEKLADVPAQPTNSTAQVTDPAVTNSSQRFYRVVTPPWP